MNIGRAIEISSAAETFNITYMDEPVIIQHVDENTKTARIYYKKEPEREHEVPVLYLIEE
ncbi:H-type small acid-soluble spore protein [Cytobacillus gottheilii]|uniref:Small, acid-soluble spore protein H n=1 Tax=Cytobacillus gottheilii TaxID=859144 RepID=A0ABX8F8M9_9BACI|nr:H-type small acid-soluble spore protein [Cytobacillus gottheilii]QVY59872.1 H-type small acid-soluble spore protein [Cytobacillus gottheilii]